MQENADFQKMATEIPYGLKHRRQSTVITGTASEPKEARKKVIKNAGRRSGIRHGAIDRPNARVRSGLPTGTTAHFKEWKRVGLVKSALQRTKLDKLADSLSDSGKQSIATAIAIIRVNSPLKTVWDLARADLGYLLRIPQIGPARLETVEKYLRSQNVVLDWTVA